MSKYLPTQYQQMFYVYFHVDPETGDIVYVGSGTKERAWTTRESNRNNVDHHNWLLQKETEGYTPDDYVQIVFKARSKREVLDKESTFIEDLKPVFNKTLSKWWWCLALSEDQLAQAKELRDKGISYKNIAKEVGTSTMTIYRALNGETKGYG